MQQGLQVLDKLCEKLQDDGIQQKLLVGERAKANAPASEATSVGSGGVTPKTSAPQSPSRKTASAATLKQFNSSDLRPAGFVGPTITPVGPSITLAPETGPPSSPTHGGIQRSESPRSQKKVIEVKVETRNPSPSAPVRRILAASGPPTNTLPTGSASGPSAAPPPGTSTAPPGRSRDVVGETGLRSQATPGSGMRMVGRDGETLQPRHLQTGADVHRRTSAPQQLLVPTMGGGTYGSRSRGSSPAVLAHSGPPSGPPSSGKLSDCGSLSPRNRDTRLNHAAAVLMPGSGAIHGRSNSPLPPGALGTNPGMGPLRH